MPLGTDYLYSDALERIDTDGPARQVYNALVSLEMGHITQDDFPILEALGRHQFMTEAQLCGLVTGKRLSKSRARRRLHTLLVNGLVSQVRWIIPGETPELRLAHGLSLNGALLWRQYNGQSRFPWQPGDGKRHLRVIFSILAANEFRLQVTLQQPGLITDWKIHSKSTEPTASFRLDGRLFLLDTPRTDEDVWSLRSERYTAWEDQEPIILVITPTEAMASDLFLRLRETIPPERLMFTTDERAFEGAMDAPGYLWQWTASNELVELALLQPEEQPHA